MLLARQNVLDKSYDGITEKIKRDLISKFQEKGIYVSDIFINIDSGNMNMKVCISSLFNQRNLYYSAD